MEINTIVETKHAEFFEHVFSLKTHADKPSYASSSSHAQECDENYAKLETNHITNKKCIEIFTKVSFFSNSFTSS